LHSNDLTIVRRNSDRGLYAVVTLSEAAKEVMPAVQLDDSPLAPGYQSVLRSLNSTDADTVLEAIKPLVSNGIKLTVTDAGSLSGVVVSGLRERVEYALSVIDELDSKQSIPAITIVPVQHRPAVEVLAELKTISATLASQGSIELTSDLAADTNRQAIRVIGPETEIDTIRQMIEQADFPSEIQSRSFDPRGYPLDTVASFVETMARDESPRGSGERWKMVQDELTNTLIVSGTQSELDAAAQAIEQLASMPADSRRVIRMIPVKNREATKIREIAGQLLDATLLNDGGSASGFEDEIDSSPASETRLGEHSRAIPMSRGQFEDEPRSDLELAVDSELNTIIATGTPKRIEQLEALIKDLDVRQPQVQLEIVMLSLSESQSKDFGVELAGNIDTGKTLIGLGSLFGLTSISPSSTSAQATGTGGSAVVLSPGDFSAVLRAIETINDGRSVSMPSMVVNNNETANLNSTSTQPYTTTTIQDSNVITARGGSASAGTTITVSPQIAAGDDIVLDYSMSLSSFVGEAASSGVEPPSQQTSLNSVATIPDGYTIALGGIEISSEGDSDTKTPVLADIPLLGGLFKSQSDSTSRSRFYIFIRATVMRSPSFEHLKYISEDLAQQLNVDDGWPEVEPRIMR
jgi:type II secretory pathway component GspD/PulD (secretin)